MFRRFRAPETMTAAEQAALLRATAARDAPRDHVLYSMALGTCLRLRELEDNGEGVKAGADGNPDFIRVARSICDSFKRELDPSSRRNIQGEFAIGILGFAAIGTELELISRAGKSETRGMRLVAGSVDYDPFIPSTSLPSHGTVARVREVHKEIQNRLTAEKLTRYLGLELRDRIRSTHVTIRVVDKMPGGKELLVKPQEFEGERLRGVGPADTITGKIRFELYVCGEDEQGRVGIARRGTRLLDDVCQLEELNHAPWNSGTCQ